MILIDVHEPREIVEALKEKVHSITVTKLQAGDYLFDKSVIERKTLSDFFSSLKNGRLMIQLQKCKELSASSYLIIEGFFDFSYVTDVAYLYSMLQIISIDFKTQIIFTRDQKDSAKAIKDIYFTNKGYSGGFYKQNGLSRFYLKMLTGISYNKLSTVFSRFKTLRLLALATKKDIITLHGVSRRTEEKIRKLLDSEF